MKEGNDIGAGIWTNHSLGLFCLSTHEFRLLFFFASFAPFARNFFVDFLAFLTRDIPRGIGDHGGIDTGDARDGAGTRAVLVAGAAGKGKFDDPDIRGDGSRPRGNIGTVDADTGNTERRRPWRGPLSGPMKRSSPASAVLSPARVNSR